MKFPVIVCTPHDGALDTPVMPPMMGMQPITVNQPQTLISIYIMEDIGHPPLWRGVGCPP